MTLKFESKRLIIESITDHHSISSERLFRILSDNVTKHLPPEWQSLSNKKQAKELLSKRSMEGVICSLHLKSSSDFIGLLFLYGLDTEAESNDIRIGYFIDENQWGKGLISELIASVIKQFHERANVTSIIGGVSKENIASIKVLTKNGFVLDASENDIDFYTYRF